MKQDKSSMEKVTNQQVNKIGREIAAKMLKEKYRNDFKRGMQIDYVCDDEKSYPVYYWTKTHQVRKIEKTEFKVTGKDQDRMKKIQEIADKQGDIFLVWIDALLGLVMGGRLSQLMKQEQFEGVSFPYKLQTHKGFILYWNILQIPDIGVIEPEELLILRDVIAHNRTAKDQLTLL